MPGTKKIGFGSPEARYWFHRRRVCVIGLGKSGIAAARLLKRLGASVTVTEKRRFSEVKAWAKGLPSGVKLETGGHSSLKKPWDLVVASPGAPAALWEKLKGKGVPVWGEMELAWRVLALLDRLPERVAAVTGTNGKTTTTVLLGRMFEAAGFRAVLAGNMGTPLASMVEKISWNSVLALEVSSYQLEATAAFRPSAAAVLNVTPDHLGRHKTMERYAKTKFRIFENQDAACAAVLNPLDPWCRKLSRTVPGRVLWFGRAGLSSALWPKPRFLLGGHNLENALAAIGCARSIGTPRPAVLKALRTFHGVSHRLEFVRAWRGVRFINDSKATNVDSTSVALKAVRGPVYLILGGEHKGSSYAPLRPLLKEVKGIILIGEAAGLIRKDLSGTAPFYSAGTLEKAVEAARKLAKPGDAVLLSPACASFDQFDNFEHRGNVFKELVNAL